jgi:hypothetical protein
MGTYTWEMATYIWEREPLWWIGASPYPIGSPIGEIAKSVLLSSCFKAGSFKQEV